MRAVPLFVLVLVSCGLVSPPRPDGGGGGAPNGGGTGGAGGGFGAGAATGGGEGTAGGSGGGSGTGGGATLAWSFRELAATAMPMVPRFIAVHGLSADDYWVVTDDGKLLHSEGGVLVERFAQPGLSGVAAAATGEVFAVSTHAMHWCVSDCGTPSAIFSEQLPAQADAKMNGVCTHPTLGTFAVGFHDFGGGTGNSVIYAYAGGTWTRVYYSSNVRDLKSCFFGTDGWARAPGIEDLARIKADGGSGSDEVGPATPGQLWWAGAATVDGGMVVGGAGWKIVQSATGTQWTSVSNPSSDAGAVRAVTALGTGSDVVAGGTFTSGRSLYLRQRGAWRPMALQLDVYGLWGVDETTFIAVGEALDGGGGRVVTFEYR